MSAIQLLPQDSVRTLCQKAVLVRPEPRQLRWQELEFIGFIHFGVNTFTNKEWGDGTEDPAIFNPIHFDAEQIVGAMKDAQMKAVILTCKHHDGFCLWPSAYTEHSVKNSPWKDGKGDVVREISDACKKLGMKFGVYLSPWDRHDPRYGTGQAYNRYYLDQLHELLTGYGEIFDLWLDGACAEGPNGKKQDYAWREINAMVRTLQPQATITGVAPDARWCGNEAGVCRSSEWSAVPISGTDGQPPEISEKTAYAITRHNVGDTSLCCNEDLASISKLQEHAQKSDWLYWYPAQVDLSIRPGWFYHDYEDDLVRPLDKMIDIYLNAVGGNSQLLLNLPPNQDGLIHPNDVKRLREIGSFITQTFQTNAVTKMEKRNDHTFVLTCDPSQQPDLLALQEDITQGQRVESFTVSARASSSAPWERIATQTTIGYRKFVRLKKQSYFQLQIEITAARDIPCLKPDGIKLHTMPTLSKQAQLRRDDSGMLSMSAQGAQIFYTLDGSLPTQDSAVYTAPICYPMGGIVTASAVYDNDFAGALTCAKEFGLLQKDYTITNFTPQLIDTYHLDQLFSSDETRFARMPHGEDLCVAFDMQQVYTLKGLHYMPVCSGYEANFNIAAYSLFTSENGVDFQEVLKAQELSNIYHNPILHQVTFEQPIRARYVQFKATHFLNPNTAVLGELSLLSV